MKVSFNEFKREYAAHKAVLDAAMQRVAASGWFILGPEMTTFEEKFARTLGVTHVIGVANGLEALQISLMALDIGPGDEVITTSMSAVATALAIRAVGATPVFADIDQYFHIDITDIEHKIKPWTKAIIPVHLYGQAADMDSIMALAKKHNLRVIEDCAQSATAQFGGTKTGTIGNLGAFSFYPTKNLGAFGDAGAISTNDDALAEKCRAIRNYGQKNRYEHETVGLNSRLDDLQAAVLSTKLDYLATDNARRNEIALMYRTKLTDLAPALRLPKQRTNADHTYHLFVIECDRRDELQKFLADAGITTIIHYPIPIHRQKCFENFYNSIQLPVTEAKVSTILSLPIHPYMTNEEVEYVCAQIRAFFDASSAAK